MGCHPGQLPSPAWARLVWSGHSPLLLVEIIALSVAPATSVPRTWWAGGTGKQGPAAEVDGGRWLHPFPPSRSWGGTRALGDPDGLCNSLVAPPLPPPCIDSLNLGDRQVAILSREKNISIHQWSLGGGLKGPRDSLSNAVLGYPDQYASAPDACLLSLQLEGEQQRVMWPR